MFLVWYGLLFPSADICIHLQGLLACSSGLHFCLHKNCAEIVLGGWNIWRYLLVLNKSFWAPFYYIHCFKTGSHSCFICFFSGFQKEIFSSCRDFLLFESSNWTTKGVLHCLYTTTSKWVLFDYVALYIAIPLQEQGNSMNLNSKVTNQFHSWGNSLHFTGVLLTCIIKTKGNFLRVFSTEKWAWKRLFDQLKSYSPVCCITLYHQNKYTKHSVSTYVT